MSQLSDLTARFLDLQRGNIQRYDQLLGTEFMPKGYVSTVGQQTGPQGFGENLANFFGLYKDTRTKDLVGQAEKNRSLLNQAQEAMTLATKAKIDAETDLQTQENRQQDALDLDTTIDRQIDMLNRTGDIYSRLQREAGDISTEQSIKQMQALYPYLDAAGQKAVERNLDASMRFKAFKEQLPSSIQAIMESKQRQQDLASSAFAREAGAIATQQQAATGFAGLGTSKYSGRRIA